MCVALECVLTGSGKREKDGRSWGVGEEEGIYEEGVKTKKIIFSYKKKLVCFTLRACAMSL